MQLKTLMMSASIAAVVAGGAFAQDDETKMTDEQPMAAETDTTGMDTTGMDTTGTTDGEVAQAPTFESLDEMTVGDVVGFVAYDPEDNRIGEIDYVVKNGDGADAVIGIGGFLGLGEYTVALPLDEFELREDGMSFVLNTDKETLKEQPEFDESGVEGLPDETPVADLLKADDKADPAMNEDATASDATANAEDQVESEQASDDQMTAEEEATGEDAATDQDVATDAETDMDADEDAAATDSETKSDTTTQ